MKNLLLAFIASTALLTAGGDITPVEPILETQVEKPGNFYIGLGAIYVYKNETTDKQTAIGGTGILGYQANEYAAFEYRGTLTDGSYSKNGIYVKLGGPIPIGVEVSKVNLYAIGGYSQIHFKDTGSKDQAELGLGLEIKDVVANTDIFIDGLYSLRTDRIVPLVGIKYNF
ncbi:MAG: hypothetical protein DRG59_12190 [Deltaproteobacteria bacterium]|nr:MAG: hypothetical protein DRG59_12190 [Deltaproteobacteria bacterium]